MTTCARCPEHRRLASTYCARTKVCVSKRRILYDSVTLIFQKQRKPVGTFHGRVPPCRDAGLPTTWCRGKSVGMLAVPPLWTLAQQRTLVGHDQPIHSMAPASMGHMVCVPAVLKPCLVQEGLARALQRKRLHSQDSGTQLRYTYSGPSKSALTELQLTVPKSMRGLPCL